MKTLFRAERGSALLISLVMIVVITVLGLALFELGQIEGQQSGASLSDARAFEVAQAGLERAIRELRNGFLADAYGSESWVDGVNRPICVPACETGVYRQMTPLLNNTLPETAPAGSSFIALSQTGRDPGGTFVIELKQVTVAEANNPISQGANYTYPYGQTCIPSAPANATVCANLMFVRSTGTVNGPPGSTAISTVQALVRANSTSFFAGGLTADTGGGNDAAIDGQALIAGSIGILGTDTITPAFQIAGGATAGMRNNWAALWPDTNTPPTLARLAPRQLICPTGANCGGGANLVESLGAELKIYGNVSHTMVTLNGGTDLGINAIQTAIYGDGTSTVRRGKGRIDGVYVADGCPVPCLSTAFSLNGGSLIYVDTNNYTKPYPDRLPKLPLHNQLYTAPFYPTTDDSTVIAGATYASWRANFFVAARGVPALDPVVATGGSCSNAGNAFFYGSVSATGLIGSAFNSLDDTNNLGPEALRGFCHQFSFTKKDGVVVPLAEICWKRNFGANPASANSLNLPPNYDTMPTLEFGIPSCDQPSSPSNPLLFQNWREFRTRKNAVDVTIQYRGSAIILLQGNDINIEQTLQTTCATLNPTCLGERFPEDNLLVLIQRGSANTDIAFNNPGTDRVERFMAYVFSENRIRAWRQTNIVGSLRGQQICFRNNSASGCGGSGHGAGIPGFYQASFIDSRQIPEELPASSGTSGDRWLVNVVPRFWMVCRRSPTDTLLTLPTTPTGTCQYQ
jgi:Tfp pilus assembly protein PilX